MTITQGEERSSRAAAHVERAAAEHMARVRASRVTVNVRRERHPLRLVVDGLELLAVVCCIPIVIILVGLPFALAGRLLIELVHRF